MESELDKVIAINNLEATHRDIWESKDKNRELHELLGLCWHEFHRSTGPYYICRLCKNKFGDHREFVASTACNPDYAADPLLVLREMMLKCKDWNGFVDQIGARIGGQAYFHHAFIFDTTGRLRDLAIEWLRKEIT